MRCRKRTLWQTGEGVVLKIEGVASLITDHPRNSFTALSKNKNKYNLVLIN